MTTKDLWGSISRVEPVDSPVRVLQEQAELLKQKTKGQLVGGVATQALQNRLRTTLAVIAPGLDNYRFDLVSIYHTYDFYPLVLSDDLNKKRKRCHSESEFKKGLEANTSVTFRRRFCHML